MAKKEFIEAREIIQELFQEREINLHKIIIFGSQAKNKGNQDSDIDIIVVSKDFRNKDIFEKVEVTSGIHRELVNRLKKPVDIMYYSDKEWDKGYSIIINAAKEEGAVIYG